MTNAYPHRIYEQYIAEIYGLTLSKQEAKSWSNKCQKFDIDIANASKGISKAIEKDDMTLYLKLLDRWSNLIEQRHAFLYPKGL